MSNLIFKKMVDVMRDIGAVGKDQKNTAQNFKFRGIDQFINAAHPALVKHGVFVTTEVLDKSYELKDVERSSGKKAVDKHVHLTMKYTFFAEDGSSVFSTVASEGLDSGDKATNKALSAALKYAFIQTFNVPTEDMEEADSTSPTIASTSTGFATTNDPSASVTTASTASGRVSMSTETPTQANGPATEEKPKKRGFKPTKANGTAKVAEAVEETGSWT